MINVHHLSEKIIKYVGENKFDLDITIVNEKEKILDTGGGILNSIHFFVLAHPKFYLLKKLSL